MTPFDGLASEYLALWSDHPEGRRQRQEVWRELESVFSPGQEILDLGCGVGDDALFLRSLGIRVMGIDSSAAMIAVAQGRGVHARCLPIEELRTLSGLFDGAISNFGAFNCVGDVRAAAMELARLIRPAGTLALCVMGRFSWRETVNQLLRFDLAKATRRWSGRATWRGIDVHYRSGRELSSLLAPHFALLRKTSIGAGDHCLYLYRRGDR